MKKISFILAFLACWIGHSVWADEAGLPMALTNLPPAAQDAIQQHVGKGHINQIEKNTEDGVSTYEVEMKKNGRTRSFTVDDGGELLELEVFLRETHGPLHAAIEKQADGNAINSITKVFDEGTITYEVETGSGPKTKNFTLGEAGDLEELEIALADAPAPVQAAVIKELGLDTMGDVTEVFDETGTNFQIEINPGHHSRVITIDPTGAVLSSETEVKMADTPAAVQTAIKGLTDGAQLGAITKSIEDGETDYDFDFKRDGKWDSKTVDISGKIVPP